MTETEANLLADRLTRVWGAGTGDSVALSYSDNSFSFEGWTTINDAVVFSVSVQQGFVRCELNFDYFSSMKTNACHEVELLVYEEKEDRQIFKKNFLARHKDDFRKRAWLSGVPLECSAHERMEWHLWLQEQEASCTS